MVEKWASREALGAHSEGPALAGMRPKIVDKTAGPAEMVVWTRCPPATRSRASSRPVSGAGPVPPPFPPAPARPDHPAQPDRLLGPPDQLRRGRTAHRAARGLLRRPRRRWSRADRHRRTLHAPDGLALRKADPRFPPRGHPRVPADHRCCPRPRRADLGPDQPQRRAGLEHVHPAARLGAERRPRSPLPRGAEGGRVPEIAEIVAGYAVVAGHCAGGLRRNRVAVLALLDRAGLPFACHQHAATPTADRSSTGPACFSRSPPPCRSAIGRDAVLGVRLCGDELIEGGTTIDEAVAVARMVEATGRWTTSTPRSGWPPPRCT